MTTYMMTQAGKPAPNQLVHTMESGVYLQSYNAIVAYYPHHKLPNEQARLAMVGYDWCYSATTKRYVRQFLSSIGAKPEDCRVVNLRDKMECWEYNHEYRIAGDTAGEAGGNW